MEGSSTKEPSSVSGLPVSVPGLGNYKGVMLCNRPSSLDFPGSKDQAVKPFRSRIPDTVGDALGLIRKRPEPMEHEVKQRGPSAALRRHCQWIKELQAQVKEDHALADQEDRAAEERKAKMQEVFKKQRDAIRLIKMGHNARPDELESVLKPKASKKPTSKPLWAMTEAEREEKEDFDAEDLINFAENLDYDEYVHDLEFRECLAAITDRAKKLQREQDAFKDSLLREFNEDDEAADSVAPLGGHSRHAAQRGRGVEDREDWDASTVCSEDRASEDSAARHLADQAWKDGQLKGVHSKNSIKKLVEQAQQREAEEG
eukprot:TRINITY_DN72607_c0_g1_i1.p1 TRINITY_DN72607_c0_g1~~TRINITY_DN72607_c0_g1_i1.p1  ORF type:complete len:316 (-),score=90.94 TRINITY_DN72607_c0_g1_i1:185-1132(-)